MRDGRVTTRRRAQRQRRLRWVDENITMIAACAKYEKDSDENESAQTNGTLTLIRLRRAPDGKTIAFARTKMRKQILETGDLMALKWETVK